MVDGNHKITFSISHTKKVNVHLKCFWLFQKTFLVVCALPEAPNRETFLKLNLHHGEETSLWVMVVSNFYFLFTHDDITLCWLILSKPADENTNNSRFLSGNILKLRSKQVDEITAFTFSFNTQHLHSIALDRVTAGPQRLCSSGEHVAPSDRVDLYQHLQNTSSLDDRLIKR